MKIIRYIFFALGLLTPVLSRAQSVQGTVKDAAGPLIGATVHWSGTTIGTNTDTEGRFKINRVKGYEHLVASFTGMEPDTLRIDDNRSKADFVLKEGIQLDAVQVIKHQRGNVISSGHTMKTENITFAGLTKMACCNLAESFENSASVSVGYSDAVSGARQIRMLGLSGIYTQLLDESRPVLRGLGSPYGLTFTPGMWLQSIQLSKGVSSVTSGHEGLTGQINLEYRKPTDEDKFFINGYLDEGLRSELNITSAIPVSSRISTVVLAHGSIDAKPGDHNHDGFLDTPETYEINAANRWLYAAPSGAQIRAGYKFTYDRRRGGNKDFDEDRDRGGTDVYGSRIDNTNFNFYVKGALPLGKSIYNEEGGEEMRSNLAVVADYNYYDQEGFFGLKNFEGRQNSFYGNVLYNHVFSPRHTLITGLSGTLDKYDQTLDDIYTMGRNEGGYILDGYSYNMGRTEKEAGAMAEYTYHLEEKLTVVAGSRLDYNNLHGWMLTPRAHLRWSPARTIAVRLSAGTGFRTANPVTDHIGMLATGRRIVLQDRLDLLEKSTAFGGSITWKFRLGRDDEASLSFDYFRTAFSNQIIADQEYDTGTVFVYNTDGKSATDTWQGDFNWTPLTGFDIYATFRYNLSRIELNRPSGFTYTAERPLIDKFKGLINLQYATKFRRWVFDVTAQVNGQSRLPSQEGTPGVKEYSPVYPLFFGQVTRKFRYFDVYLGCENIANYTQKHPVISADAPFDTVFNSSVVWGPLMGRKIYAGFRFTLKNY